MHGGSNIRTGGSAKRLLIVEDHAAFYQALVILLKRIPTLEVVGHAGSLAEGRAFLSSGERFDVALVDLVLPDGDGTELVSELREAAPHTSILVLTALEEPPEPARSTRGRMRRWVKRGLYRRSWRR